MKERLGRLRHEHLGIIRPVADNGARASGFVLISGSIINMDLKITIMFGGRARPEVKYRGLYSGGTAESFRFHRHPIFLYEYRDDSTERAAGRRKKEPKATVVVLSLPLARR